MFDFWGDNVEKRTDFEVYDPFVLMVVELLYLSLPYNLNKLSINKYFCTFTLLLRISLFYCYTYSHFYIN